MGECVHIFHIRNAQRSTVFTGVLQRFCKLQYSIDILYMYAIHPSMAGLYIHIRIEKHLQCEKLLGLAGRNTKKRERVLPERVLPEQVLKSCDPP